MSPPTEAEAASITPRYTRASSGSGEVLVRPNFDVSALDKGYRYFQRIAANRESGH